ncbi:hypothetical protein K402DRAFT_259763 [Aulographum hederae CBS 113979]|uniref:Uncharacterized protein n=1 Tax=Aulographum hederae CBS 113979 TaxID=1176131 RepID=A0A6G1H8U6_9PEZI|nr:hypothetical protein K402DRAFT_259763 [Aulographum hederae CBS 113979]
MQLCSPGSLTTPYTICLHVLQSLAFSFCTCTVDLSVHHPQDKESSRRWHFFSALFAVSEPSRHPTTLKLEHESTTTML